MDAAERQRWLDAQSLLDEVLESPGPRTQEAARVRAASTGCAAELGSLLAALDTHSALDAPLDDAIRDLAASRMQRGALSGRIFGRWTLGEEIGRGGMSAVYHAQRTGDGFEQHAALKILSMTFASQAMVDSFLRERQILSELQHPGIARLIDGGITPEGSPFLVMEHVNGQRIDRWCEERKPDVPTIARMVEALSRAVAHAQRHLVIHRDINASNVLVNERDEPVLIDFGIAGLLGSDGGQTLHAFTPTFAAPEQLAHERCTTATDVYAIGRLLETLSAGLDIDADLHLLIRTATARDPEQRYANARNLADDLQAWLEKRPMRARPPSLRYRAGRFVARNRWSVAAAALVIASILGGLGISLWQARIAAAERDLAQSESARANQVTVFLKALFQASGPDSARGEAVTAKELLDLGAHQARNAFDRTPELKVEMLVLLGDLYRELGELEAAKPLLRDALALAEPLGDRSAQVAALRAMAVLKMNAQEHEEALALTERAERVLQEKGDVPGLQHAQLMEPMLFSLAELGRAGEAVARGESALAAARATPDLPPAALYQYLYGLANALNISEREPESKPLLLEAQGLDLDMVGHPTIRIALLSSLSSVADVEGDLDLAIELNRESLDLARLVYPPNHPVTARKLSNLASSLNRTGRYEEAEAALREALSVYEGLYGDEVHPRVAAAHNNLGRALLLQGEYEEAVLHQARALEMAGELFGTHDPRYAIAMLNLGDLYRRVGQYEEAEGLLTRAIEIRRSVLGTDHRQVGTGMSVLSMLRLKQGRYEEALALCDEALAMFERIGHGSPAELILTRTRRAQALAGLHRDAEADAEFSALLEVARVAGGDIGAARLDLLAALAEFLVSRADPRAVDAASQALELHREMLGARHPDTVVVADLYRTVADPGP